MDSFGSRADTTQVYTKWLLVSFHAVECEQGLELFDLSYSLKKAHNDWKYKGTDSGS
jgi:hypothetical protein